MRATYSLQDRDGIQRVADSCMDDDEVPDPVVEGQKEALMRLLIFVADDPRGAFVMAQKVVNREISQTNIAARFEKAFKSPIAQENICKRLHRCAEQFPVLKPMLVSR